MPGIFLAETFIPKDADTITKWFDIDKKHYIFPSDALYSLDQNMYNKLLILKRIFKVDLNI